MEILKTNEFWYFLIPVLSGFMIYFLGGSTRDEKRNLLILFRSNQTLSQKIQSELREFIYEFNASSAVAIPERNLTYGMCLEMLEEEYKVNLSDELYNSVKKEKIPKPTLLSMSSSLNKQNEALRLLEIEIKILKKQVKQ